MCLFKCFVQINVVTTHLTEEEKTKRKRKLIAYSVIFVILLYILSLLLRRNTWIPTVPDARSVIKFF